MEQVAAHESKLYGELSHVYDRVFRHVFYKRIEKTIQSLGIGPGDRVLEVGAGTGIAFPAYPAHCEVTGIDVSADMLRKAQEKIDDNGWRNFQVMEMDAMNLTFPDNAFDHTMAFHVVSVVPDAARSLQEAVRVTKPGGIIAIVNHFRSENPFLAALDRWIEPVTRRLGWHTLARGEVLGDVPLEIVEDYKLSPFSLFSIVVGRVVKNDESARAAA